MKTRESTNKSINFKKRFIYVARVILKLSRKTLYCQSKMKIETLVMELMPGILAKYSITQLSFSS